MRDKKIFLSAMLLTTVMLFAGGCGNQAEPANAAPGITEPADTEGSTEESSMPSPSPAVWPEESMGSSEAEDNSESKADTADEGSEPKTEYEIISMDDTVMYAAADCNIMSGAGTQYDKAGSLSRAEEVTINGKVEAGEDDLWYVIKTEDGSIQMVSADMLSETKPAVQASSGNGSGSSDSKTESASNSQNNSSQNSSSQNNSSQNSSQNNASQNNSQNNTSQNTSQNSSSNDAQNTTQAPATTPETVPATTPVPTPEPTPVPTPAPTPVHEHTWKEHTATRQVWVSNMVTVEDYGVDRVCVGKEYTCDCGWTTTDRNAMDTHLYNHALAGDLKNFVFGDVYEEQVVCIGSHQEDQGYYTDETYVDYHYCDCGATK